MGALLITSQEMAATRNTLEEMRWPKPKSPIQTDNSAALGVVNNTIVPKNLRKWTATSTGSDAGKLKASFDITGQAEV